MLFLWTTFYIYGTGSVMEEKAIALEELIIDVGCQPRAMLNTEAVDEYAKAFEAGEPLPAIEVVELEEKQGYIIVDGYHRVAGCRQIDKGFIRGRIIAVGDVHDARWHASAANQKHGVRRTNADKRQAVKLALESEIGEEQSLRTIAEHCGVSHELVRTVRDDLLSGVDTEVTDPPPPDHPHDPDDKPEEDMYVTAARLLSRTYKKLSSVLDPADPVCEAVLEAWNMAKEREL